MSTYTYTLPSGFVSNKGTRNNLIVRLAPRERIDTVTINAVSSFSARIAENKSGTLTDPYLNICIDDVNQYGGAALYYWKIQFSGTMSASSSLTTSIASSTKSNTISSERGTTIYIYTQSSGVNSGYLIETLTPVTLVITTVRDTYVNSGRYNGSSYDAVQPYYYNGSAWVPCEWKRYNGSSWDNVDTM